MRDLKIGLVALLVFAVWFGINHLWQQHQLRTQMSSLSCDGEGQVQAGMLTHGIIWPHGTDEPLFADYYDQQVQGIRARAGFSVLLTNTTGLAQALRASTAPQRDARRLGEVFNAHWMQMEFDRQGKAVAARYTSGHSGSSQWITPDSPNLKRSGLAVDKVGCVRGHYRIDSTGEGLFALPLWNANAAALFAQSPEGALEGGERAPAPRPALHPDDALAQWQAIHAQLMLENPAQALLALGLTDSAAQVAAQFPAPQAMLERLRHQCPDPATSQLSPDGFPDYPEIEGESLAAPGVVLRGMVRTFNAGGAAALLNCEVFHINDEAIDQCTVMDTDCSKRRG